MVGGGGSGDAARVLPPTLAAAAGGDAPRSGGGGSSSSRSNGRRTPRPLGASGVGAQLVQARDGLSDAGIDTIECLPSAEPAEGAGCMPLSGAVGGSLGLDSRVAPLLQHPALFVAVAALALLCAQRPLAAALCWPAAARKAKV